MILSVHIADIGIARALRSLRLRRELAQVPGLRWGETAVTVPLRGSGVRSLGTAGHAVVVAAWESEDALDRLLGSGSRVAHALQRGWQARLEPVRSWGAWAALPDLPGPAAGDLGHAAGDLGGAVAVLTLGKLRLPRTISFLATSAAAERQAARHPALVAGTALARPPHFVATFSIWRSVEEMRKYVIGADPGAHRRAIAAHQKHPFHHESVFVRSRPIASRGLWNGRDPVRTAAPALSSASARIPIECE